MAPLLAVFIPTPWNATCVASRQPPRIVQLTAPVEQSRRDEFRLGELGRIDAVAPANVDGAVGTGVERCSRGRRQSRRPNTHFPKRDATESSDCSTADRWRSSLFRRPSLRTGEGSWPSRPLHSRWSIGGRRIAVPATVHAQWLRRWSRKRWTDRIRAGRSGALGTVPSRSMARRAPVRGEVFQLLCHEFRRSAGFRHPALPQSLAGAERLSRRLVPG